MRFVNLHVHSHYSLQDSVLKIEDLVKFNKENGVGCACLTEHGTLSSAYRLWKECKKNEMKPIIGLEAYYVDDITKDEGLVAGSYCHILLICKNKIGWVNLKKLQSLAWSHGFLKKPRIDFAMLKERSEGLFCATACTNGLIGAILHKNKFWATLEQKSETRRAIRHRMFKFASLFGDMFFIEIMLNELPEQIELNKYAIKLAKEYGLKIIVTNDSHYLDSEDAELHDVLKCVSFRKLLSDEDNGTYQTRNLYLANYGDLLKFKKRWHGYISDKALMRYVKNGNRLADAVEQFDIAPKESALPKFSENAKTMLKELCISGMKKLGLSDSKAHKDRVKQELEVINRLGMDDYFLIVWDIANEARRRNIPFNTRGSVAGSLVAHLIGISWIDPLRFGTTFERFLTDDRISLPDIDMDFSKKHRDELIDYLKKKYGKNSIAHIVNYSMYKPKQAIKDVARVYDVPFSVANTVTRALPDMVEKWEDLPESGDLAEFFEKNPSVPEHAEGLMGVSRHRGVHASGVVLTPGNILHWVPVAWSLTGDEDVREKVTEFDMYDLEDMNILKLDFLGQNTLDVIQYTLDLIGGKIKTFDDLYRVILNDLDNEKVYEYIRSGQLVGTFQMGTSEGMKKLIMDVKPTGINEIVVCISLYRSAVLAIGAHNKYIARRNGDEDVEYLHPKMESVLKDTLGIILFQEQTSQLAVELAGFTKTESDNFRKGIKQKDEGIFKNWEQKFIAGCKNVSGIDEDLAKSIWDEIVIWSSYGFNKNHAVSYALIAYITAWLKLYYPEQFMTSLLSHNSSDDDKLDLYLSECKKLKLKMLRPDINLSGEQFRLMGDKKILYPLTVIKGAGEKAIVDIVESRKRGGKFKSLEDFYGRVNKRVVNVRVIQNMIFAGCFRKFGTMDGIYNEFADMRGKDNTLRALYCVDCDKKYPVSITEKKAESGVACPECGSVNILSEPSLIKKKKFNAEYCRNIVFGFVSQDPLKAYKEEFEKYKAMNFSSAIELDGQTLTVGGVVTGIRKHIDRRQNEMAFIKLSDGTMSCDMIVFSDLWEEYKAELKTGGVYVLRVRVDGEKFLLVRSRIEGSASLKKIVLK